MQETVHNHQFDWKNPCFVISKTRTFYVIGNYSSEQSTTFSNKFSPIHRQLFAIDLGLNEQLKVCVLGALSISCVWKKQKLRIPQKVLEKICLKNINVDLTIWHSVLGLVSKILHFGDKLHGTIF